MVYPMCFESQELPLWVTIFERIGPGSAVLVFVGAVVWKLLPACIKMLAAWRLQSEEVAKVMPCLTDFAKAMTNAAPDALDGLRDLAQNAERIADHVVGLDRDEEHRRRARVWRSSDDSDSASSATQGG